MKSVADDTSRCRSKKRSYTGERVKARFSHSPPDLVYSQPAHIVQTFNCIASLVGHSNTVPSGDVLEGSYSGSSDVGGTAMCHPCPIAGTLLFECYSLVWNNGRGSANHLSRLDQPITRWRGEMIWKRAQSLLSCWEREREREIHVLFELRWRNSCYA